MFYKIQIGITSHYTAKYLLVASRQLSKHLFQNEVVSLDCLLHQWLPKPASAYQQLNQKVSTNK